MMIYLFYHSWTNTSSNHAGMKYMCDRLEQLYPNRYRAIEIAKEKNNKYRKHTIVRGINYILRPISKYLENRKLKKKISSLNLQREDIVVLTEYMDRNVGQIQIAELVRNVVPSIKVFGISHLVPSKLDSQFNKDDLFIWLNKIDGLITLGSSLTKYYVEHGMSQYKILTTFHYLDDYYIVPEIKDNKEFCILAQGNQMRDIDKLATIIQNNPKSKFIVCQGVLDLSQKLNFANVDLRPYMEEDELRYLMKECSVSLNVMKDTIGSNVIVTSLGMGQAMICSDVGSIRDYCTTDNCYFCNTTEDFSKAISALESDAIELNKMRENSLLLAQQYKIKYFEKELYTFLKL